MLPSELGLSVMPRWLRKPYRTSALSPPWALIVNSFAASLAWSPQARRRLYHLFRLPVGNAIIHPRCYFHTADLTNGPGVTINYGVHVENVANVSIGARTGVASLVTILTSTHTLGPHEQRHGEWTPKPVKVGAGCWIGVGATILPGVTIGDGCLIAAGAVVREDCQPDGLYAGVPARRIKDLPPQP